MNVLVFGKTGQVARELARTSDIQMTFLSRDQADLSNPSACASAIGAAKPDAVINAAAYTNVDGAESNALLAQVINADAPGAMARACAKLGIPFLHVSTDYVFDGSGHNFRMPNAPTTPTAPINIYGKTKLAGEAAVRQAGGTYAILRTSWVFSAHGGNFVKTMLRLTKPPRDLNIVTDQIGGPTPAAGIAAALVKMTKALQAGTPSGTWHYAGTPAVSWADFAREIFKLTGRKVIVTDIASSAYLTPANRPLNSRLDCATITADFGITPPEWKSALADVLREIHT